MSCPGPRDFMTSRITAFLTPLKLGPTQNLCISAELGGETSAPAWHRPAPAGPHSTPSYGSVKDQPKYVSTINRNHVKHQPKEKSQASAEAYNAQVGLFDFG